MSAQILDLKQSASTGCEGGIGGAVKMWIGRFEEIASITQTAVAGTPTPGYNISAITWTATNGLAEYEPSDNKTFQINETQADAGGALDISAILEYEGLSAEKIYSLNELKKECKLVAFVKYRSGTIRMFGVDFPTSSTYQIGTTPLRAKIGSNSGTGNNDYEKANLELVGQAKYLGMTTTVTETALNAMNFS